MPMSDPKTFQPICVEHLILWILSTNKIKYRIEKTKNTAYLVGIGYSGKNLAKISTSSPRCSELSAHMYRPEAEGVS